MGFADMPETTIGTRHDAWRMHEFTRNLCQPSLVRLPQPARQALNLTLTANKRPHFWLLTGSKCKSWLERAKFQHTLSSVCLLYTSDAADEEDSVDLGGRRIIKKKK